MPVEIGGLLEQRDEAVDPRELDERFDGWIVEAGDDLPECESRADLRTQSATPARFVCPKIVGPQSVTAQRPVEDVGSELPAQGAVVDAATRRRLHEAGRVAYDDDPRTERPVNRPERQDLEPRLGKLGRRNVVLARHVLQKGLEALPAPATRS